MSNYEYDELFDELKKLESETNFKLANSPTMTVGFDVVDKLNKVKHNHPMLSLDKTKSIDEVQKFIGNKPILTMLKMDGCFISSTPVTMADGTKKKISRIKKGEYVLSCNNDGVVEPKKVLNVFNNGLKPQEEWMRIYTTLAGHRLKNLENSKHNGVLRCTKNHLFMTQDGYKRADNLTLDDVLYTPYRSISKEQESIILGILLGDGHCINRSSYTPDVLEVHYSKTIKQNDDILVDYLGKCFKSFNPKITKRTSGYSNVKNNMKDINLHTMALPEYFANPKNHLRCGLTFTEDILSHMTPLSWALFFLDDGNRMASQKEGKNVTNLKARANLSVHRHKYNEVKLLSEFLKKQGFNNYIKKDNRMTDTSLGDGYYITISTEDSYNFFKMIAPYIPKSFRNRKLPNELYFQNCEEIKWWEKDDSYIGVTKTGIAKIESPNNYQKQHSVNAYDIEVEDNHNYFVNGVLVHNCTVSAHYDEKGDLVSAETRGNGLVGEDVLSNFRTAINVPQHIENNGVPLTVDGEIIISKSDFDKINASLPEEEKYKTPRNLASGSVRQLDSGIAAQRHIQFVAWRVVSGYDNNSFSERLNWLETLGFTVVPRLDRFDERSINFLKIIADKYSYPIDGLVVSFDDVEYLESLGATSHHLRGQLAYKFTDEEVETTLLDIEWSTCRSGVVSPTAIFEPVEIEGTTVQRATLHNLSRIKDLKLGIGDKILVTKQNSIIPAVSANLTCSNSYKRPILCKSCGAELEIHNDNGSETLHCPNEECLARMLDKFVHFVSKDGLDIQGLSEQTLEKFISKGWINKFSDIYRLNNYKNEIIALDGFGEKSWERLWQNIQESRNITMAKFIYALGIPLVGKNTAKAIAKYTTVEGSDLSFGDMSDKAVFTPAIAKSILAYCIYCCYNRDNIEVIDELNIISEEIETVDSPFTGKTIVVTGSLNNYSRTTIQEELERLGAKMSSSVSKKTDFLLTNEKSGSSKYKKAVELGIKIINEEEFEKMKG